MTGTYTAVEDQFIMSNPNMPIKELAERLGRTEGSVSSRRFTLCTRRNQGAYTRYTHLDMVYIAEHKHDTDAEIAEALGKTEASVASKRKRMGYKSIKEK